MPQITNDTETEMMNSYRKWLKDDMDRRRLKLQQRTCNHDFELIQSITGSGQKCKLCGLTEAY